MVGCLDADCRHQPCQRPRSLDRREKKQIERNLPTITSLKRRSLCIGTHLVYGDLLVLSHESILDSEDLLGRLSLSKSALCHPSPHVQTTTGLSLKLKDEGTEKAPAVSANLIPPRYALGLSSQLSCSPRQHAVTTKKAPSRTSFRQWSLGPTFNSPYGNFLPCLQVYIALRIAVHHKLTTSSDRNLPQSPPVVTRG